MIEGVLSEAKDLSYRRVAQPPQWRATEGGTAAVPPVRPRVGATYDNLSDM